MLKNTFHLLLAVLLLTSCAAAPVDEPVNVQYGFIAGDELSDGQIAEIAAHLIETGQYMLTYHCTDVPKEWEHSIQDGNLTWYRVRDFQTMQSLRYAFERIYSLSRCEQDVYSSFAFATFGNVDSYDIYREFNGILYARDGGGAGRSLYFDPDIVSVISKDTDKIIVRTTLFFTGSPSDFVDLAIIRERGMWVLDSSLVAYTEPVPIQSIVIAGVEYSAELLEMNLMGGLLTDSDIEPLKHMTGLKTLWLTGNQISDVSALAELTSLTHLDLTGNQISDISTLRELANLKTLYLSDNQISDISALSGLSGLISLSLSNNRISDISALSGLTNLVWLDLRGNQISDISALFGVPAKWSEFNLDYNPIDEEQILEFASILHRQHNDWIITYSSAENVRAISSASYPESFGSASP
ncbi:MAG: leucine-rich repeat domain-containing protein [Oscillospiraceae bacterium]|nr:leucine-rich repeat domain-containing protein [Oscillospiraceae bacterium]